MANSLPTGYVHRAIPKSTVEAASAKAHDRIKSISKNALEQYFRSFFDSDGRNRTILDVVSPAGLTYITDKSIQSSNDPTVKKMQLARLYNEVREHVPAILIVDAGFINIPSGLGEIHNARNYGTKWIGQFVVIRQIPVVVSVLTADQDSTDMIMSLLTIILGSVRNMAGGSRMYSTEPGDNWEVRIPLNFTPTATTGSNITEDPKDQVWAAGIDVVLDYEDSFLVEQDIVEISTPGTPYVATSDSPSPADLPPIIQAPDEIQFNTQSSFNIDRFRPSHRIIVTRPDIASIDTESLLITPRKLGTFNLQIIDVNKPQSDNTLMNPSVVASKEIVVVM